MEHYRRRAEELYTQTDKALVLNLGALSLGNIARVPGPGLKYPRGIRDVEEWYISLSTRRDHVYKIFERQTEINMANLAKDLRRGRQPGGGGVPDGHGFRRPERAVCFSPDLPQSLSCLFTSRSTIGCIATPPGRPSFTVAVPFGRWWRISSRPALTSSIPSSAPPPI